MKKSNNHKLAKPGTSEQASEAEESQAFLNLIQCADLLDAARLEAEEWNKTQPDADEGAP